MTPALVLACRRHLGLAGRLPVSPPGLAFAVGAAADRGRQRAAARRAQADGACQAGEAKVGLDLLLSGPILRNLLFFFCIAMANGGIQTFTVVAWAPSTARRPRPPISALSGFLLFSAAGVLLGGIIADRTPHHEWVAAVGFACTSAMAILMGWVDMPAVVLIIVMSLGGLLNGIIQPSRDMMVRAVTPPGSFGKVFGFVTTGFNLGGMVAPLLYRLADGSRRAARHLHDRRRLHPSRAGDRHHPRQASG